MVVYNTEIIFVIDMEHVCANYIPWSYWDVMMYDIFLRFHFLKCKICSAVFYLVFNINVNIKPIH